MKRRIRFRWGDVLVAGFALLASTVVSTAPRGEQRPVERRLQPPRTASAPAPPSKAFLDTYCITCHNQRLKTGGLTLDALDVMDVSAHAASGRRSSSSCGPA
jgi:cytochrome c5